METSRIVNRKLRATLKAAIYGAAASAALILVNFLAELIWGHSGSGNFFQDLFGLLAIIEAIPTALVCSTTGWQFNLATLLLINLPLGAVIFATVEAIWQCFFKNDIGADQEAQK